eukprot:279377_1
MIRVVFMLAILSLSKDVLAGSITFVGSSEAVCSDNTSNCNDTVRLTPSLANQTGAFWSNTKIDASVGFEISFSFRISNSSRTCPSQHFTSPLCVTRGGHGFALVLQNHGPDPLSAMGTGSDGMGYSGLTNAIALEFDSWYDAHKAELFDNHVSLHANGVDPISNHQDDVLGATPSIPDLMDQQVHSVSDR